MTGAAVGIGVVVGTARWLAGGSLGGDGAEGVAITLYFLLGGILFSVLGRPCRRDRDGYAVEPVNER